MILTAFAVLTDVRTGLLVVFNAGIIFRIIQIKMSAIADEDESASAKKRIKNHIKAAVIINLVTVITFLIWDYYK